MALEEQTNVKGGKLPPGMVLGPDGKPCKVCTGFKAWTGATKKKKQSTSGSTPPSAESAGASASATATATAAAGAATLATTSAAANSAAAATDDDGRLPRDCPADVERLGRHTWTFLHTTASYYPPDPTQQQRTSMLSLLRALPVLYPCHTCADELGSYMKAHPPEKAVEQGRTSLERWLCEVHNEVNVRLGKEEFNCDSVPERWRDGWKDGRCD